MDFILNEIEARVLGALIEKDITTPDYYPLSLNALTNACNQKNNREPVMNLDEDSIRKALRTLNEKGLAGSAGGADSRVSKYEHRLQEAFNFGRQETAVICVLLLRGPQTLGELRGRTDRMYHFEELADVLATLDRLMKREPPLVKMLPRSAGTRESRYAHLFSGDVPGWEPPVELHPAAPQSPAEADSIRRLESEVAALRTELAELRQQMDAFRKQFE
jgi:uncharacterized protein YceH (UPF0502 family)